MTSPQSLSVPVDSFVKFFFCILVIIFPEFLLKIATVKCLGRSIVKVWISVEECGRRRTHCVKACLQLKIHKFYIVVSIAP